MDSNKHPKLTIAIAWLFFINLPYLLGVMLPSEGFVFSGFVFNPLDGNSYLAKMAQGWQGGWLFTLPYSADAGNGVFLFPFYLLLGHMARLLGLSLPVMFHLARILSAVFLLFQVKRYIDFSLADKPEGKNLAFFLVLFGAGMGWLVFFAGQMTSDFWVAEAYAFHSAYANPHFALGLGLLLWIFRLANQPDHFKDLALTGLLCLLLSLIQPFGAAVALVVLAVSTGVKWLLRQSPSFLPLLAAGAVGGAGLLYQYWVIRSHPVLQLWNAQNITASPLLWDLFLSFSPALLLALFWLAKVRQKKLSEGAFFNAIWLASALVMMYVPFNLQRRFITGFSVPVFVLAVLTTLELEQNASRLWSILRKTWVAVSLPTVILLVIAGCFGVLNRDEKIYLSVDERQALNWVAEHTAPDALIASSPELGNYIPAYTGRRVLYGHPFETVNAGAEKQFLEDLFSGKFSAGEFKAVVQNRKIDYLLADLREESNGFFAPEFLGKPVFESGKVAIYSIGRP